jgi:hypothetical protein
MMDTVIRALLLTMPSVTALVAQRVYTKILPQSATFPAVRVQLIDENEVATLRGPVNTRRTRVQVDSVGLTGSDADAVDLAVHGDGVTTGLRTYRGPVGAVFIQLIMPDGVRSTYDAEELRQYKVMRDYLITWSSA